MGTASVKVLYDVLPLLHQLLIPVYVNANLRVFDCHAFAPTLLLSLNVGAALLYSAPAHNLHVVTCRIAPRVTVHHNVALDSRVCVR